MSFGTDFFGALATNVGNEMKQGEDERRQQMLQLALERRRRMYQQQDDELRRQQGKEDWVDQQNATANPEIRLGEDGLMGAFQDQYEMQDGRIKRKSTRLADAQAPSTGTGKIRKYRSDGQWITEEQDAMGHWSVIATSAERSGGSGRAPAAPKPVKGADGLLYIPDPNDPTNLVLMKGQGVKPDKAPTDASIREAANAAQTDMASIRKAKPGDVATINTVLEANGIDPLDVANTIQGDAEGAVLNGKPVTYFDRYREMAMDAVKRKHMGGANSTDPERPAGVPEGAKFVNGQWVVKRGSQWFRVELNND